MSQRYDEDKPIPMGKIITFAVGLVICAGLMFSAGNLVENLSAGQIMVIQSPIAGKLNWYTDPGVKWQGFGRVTKYDRRAQYWFSAKSDQGSKADQSIKIRFNDGGHASISGSMAWEMPLDEEHLTMIHKQYGSQQAVEQQLMCTVTDKSVYMTGPLMSSKESYAEHRNDLLALIEEQVQTGVYATETVEQKVQDAMSNQMKTVNVVKIKRNEKGDPILSEASPLKSYGIKVFNVSINEVRYDDDVESQIKQQQQATMQVQIAMAKAKEAEQKAITTEKEGQASAMQAKWEQEALRSKAVVAAQQEKDVAVTKAQQGLEVAKLDCQAAEQFKQAETLRGQGEGARRKLVMEADGALEKKLGAYVEVNKLYADAISRYGGSWVPNVVMGGGTSGTNAPGAMQLIDLLTAKTAHDLSLDMNVPNIVKPAQAPAH
jgi:regulator of protease activity HflC (stomatin/prohibitin superfamily)